MVLAVWLLLSGADVGHAELHSIRRRGFPLLLLLVDVLEIIIVENDLLNLFLG